MAKFAPVIRASPQLEIQNSCFSMAVGAVFIANWLYGVDLYQRFPAIYQYMGWLPMWAWGLIYGLAGAVHLFSVLWDRTRLRKTILLIKSFLWMFFSVNVLRGDTLAFSGVIFLICALSAALAFLSLSRKRPPDDDQLPLDRFAS